MATGSPHTWGEVTRHAADEFMRVLQVDPLEPGATASAVQVSKEARVAARTRLQSLGRIIAADLFLGQKDRITMPCWLNCTERGPGDLASYLELLESWAFDSDQKAVSELMVLVGNMG